MAAYPYLEVWLVKNLMKKFFDRNRWEKPGKSLLRLLKILMILILDCPEILKQKEKSEIQSLLFDRFSRQNNYQKISKLKQKSKIQINLTLFVMEMVNLSLSEVNLLQR